MRISDWSSDVCSSDLATLARVVRRAPEVLVKVTGRKKGAKHLAAHLDYIGRHGDIPLETRDGEQIATKEEAHRIADEWSDPLYWRQGTTVSAVAMVFSMPAGTDPETVKQSVREAAERMIGDNHDYLMSLHTDTPRPHVHLTVQAEGIDRKRFDPRREDLFRFREAFAEARSEEHTSELQSLMRISYAVFCLKKKQIHNYQQTTRINTTGKNTICTCLYNVNSRTYQ